MSSADCVRGLCPLDSRPSPGKRPMRTAPEGSALWTPAGAYAPDPEMLRISLSPAGGTGIMKFPPFFHTMLTSPPKAGRSGRPFSLPPFTNILFSKPFYYSPTISPFQTTKFPFYHSRVYYVISPASACPRHFI